MGNICSSGHSYDLPDSRYLFEKYSQRTEGIKIRIFEGRLKECKASVIVNDANPQLTNEGQLSFELLTEAGSNVQRECDQYLKQKGPLGVGEVLVTDSGSLGCSKLLHTVGPQWMGGDNQESAALEDVVSACLESAEKLSAKSIAFPPLIREPYNIPVFFVSRAMMTAISAYIRHRRERKGLSSSLKEIHLVAPSGSVARLFVQDANDILRNRSDETENYSTSTSETILGYKQLQSGEICSKTMRKVPSNVTAAIAKLVYSV